MAVGVAGLFLASCSDVDDLTALESVLSIDYDVQNNIYVVVGKSPEGDIDVYTGQHNDWTKLQENRDIDNRYSPSEFLDFSIGDGDAMYGVAVGNKVVDVDPRPGSANVDLQQRGTSINAREFYGKPFFGDGAPRVISE